MRYSLQQTTPPEIEPVGLSDAKDHLLVTHTSDDTLIARLIRQARRYVENQTKRQLITAVWKMIIDEFPTDGDRIIYIPKGPVQTGRIGTELDDAEILYLDIDGVQQTLDPSKYRVDATSAFGRIQEAYNETWPDTQPVMNAVEISFVAGYGDETSDIPEDLVGAMLLLVGAWYEQRDQIVSGQYGQLPLGVDDILAPYRLVQYS
jgi:uncharacterized phiE125 gp8 family phage protein